MSRFFSSSFRRKKVPQRRPVVLFGVATFLVLVQFAFVMYRSSTGTGLQFTAQAPVTGFNKDKFTVVISEPLGSEQTMFRVTTCDYALVEDPMRCGDNPGDASDFPNICADSEGNLRKGRYVTACPKSDGGLMDPTNASCSEEARKPVRVPRENDAGEVFWRLTNCAAEFYKTENEAVSHMKEISEGPTPCYVPEAFVTTPSRDDDPREYTKCERVAVLQSDSGAGLITQYISGIYQWAAGMVGIIAVLVIVVSGIQITMARGEGSDQVSAAKERITQSLAALVLLFLSGLLLYTINPSFFV